MATLAIEDVQNWAAQLEALNGLLADEVPADLSVRTASIGEEVEVPTAVAAMFDDYERRTAALDAALTDTADPSVQRALSATAAGDLEAAVVALELGRRADGEVSTASEGDGFLISQAADIQAQLLALPIISGGQTPPPPWKTELEENLDKVIKESSACLETLGTSSAVATVAGDLSGAATKIFGGALRGAIDAVKDAFHWFKKKALELLAKALDKITKIFGAEVHDSIKKWVDDKAAKLPSDVFNTLVGRKAAIDKWVAQAAAGVDVGMKIGDVKNSASAHLSHLKWADRGTTLLGILAPIIIASAAFSAGVSMLARAVIAVALAGWLFWAAWDHCGDIRALA